MTYYLRKNWKKIVLPCFLTILTNIMEISFKITEREAALCRSYL